MNKPVEDALLLRVEELRASIATLLALVSLGPHRASWFAQAVIDFLLIIRPNVLEKYAEIQVGLNALQRYLQKEAVRLSNAVVVPQVLQSDIDPGMMVFGLIVHSDHPHRA